MGAPVLGSLAALEKIALAPFAETARTLPTRPGTARKATFTAGSKVTSPALVPRYPRDPAEPITRELGTPGSVMAVPAVLLLVSMGTMVDTVPNGGAKEVLTYTVVFGLPALGTVTWNRLL